MPNQSEIIEFLKTYKAPIIIILAGFFLTGMSFYLFIEIAEEVLEKEEFYIDSTVQNLIEPIRSTLTDNIFGYITEGGSVWFLSVASIVLLVYLFLNSKYSNWFLIYFTINMIGIAGLTKGLKLLFERERPEVLEQYDGSGFSFPSGHSTGAIAFYGFVIYLIVISHLDKKWKWLINIVLGIFALLVATSRVFINVHYVTDVVAGISLGLTFLFVCIFALEVTLWQNRRKKKRVG
ncbi:phosphatase PAP2 family protein [Saliterribacillus persicus]|uniref:Undecaprenyl-diphosphatase n=1 Tax=Saliterribacillus persicus TaxID=930114 RepID=A0A368YB72_9BACI|nr:phosphatase PAP2 family protein [Saliterribacillus persicus]RCW77510.1 undecaprenyl-diphosphatase [Saliterribacillus persicus]